MLRDIPDGVPRLLCASGESRCAFLPAWTEAQAFVSAAYAHYRPQSVPLHSAGGLLASWHLTAVGAAAAAKNTVRNLAVAGRRVRWRTENSFLQVKKTQAGAFNSTELSLRMTE